MIDQSTDQEWVRVASRDEMKPGRLTQVMVGDEPVLLACTDDGEILATSDICSHEYVLLHDGWLEGDEVECPQHGSKFSLRSGEVMNLPATQPIDTYDVKIEGGEILLRGPRPGLKT